MTRNTMLWIGAITMACTMSCRALDSDPMSVMAKAAPVLVVKAGSGAVGQAQPFHVSIKRSCDIDVVGEVCVWLWREALSEDEGNSSEGQATRPSDLAPIASKTVGLDWEYEVSGGEKPGDDGALWVEVFFRVHGETDVWVGRGVIQDPQDPSPLFEGSMLLATPSVTKALPVLALEDLEIRPEFQPPEVSGHVGFLRKSDDFDGESVMTDEYYLTPVSEWGRGPDGVSRQIGYIRVDSQVPINNIWVWVLGEVTGKHDEWIKQCKDLSKKDNVYHWPGYGKTEYGHTIKEFDRSTFVDAGEYVRLYVVVESRVDGVPGVHWPFDLLVPLYGGNKHRLGPAGPGKAKIPVTLEAVSGRQRLGPKP